MTKKEVSYFIVKIFMHRLGILFSGRVVCLFCYKRAQRTSKVLSRHIWGSTTAFGPRHRLCGRTLLLIFLYHFKSNPLTQFLCKFNSIQYWYVTNWVIGRQGKKVGRNKNEHFFLLPLWFKSNSSLKHSHVYRFRFCLLQVIWSSDIC